MIVLEKFTIKQNASSPRSFIIIKTSSNESHHGYMTVCAFIFLQISNIMHKSNIEYKRFTVYVLIKIIILIIAN